MNTHQAIKTGNIPLIIEKINTKQIHLNYKFGGLSALHLAIMYGQEEIVHLLLKAGAPAGSLTDNTSASTFSIPVNSSPLYLAIQFDKPDIFFALFNAGAVVRKEDLILAVELNNLGAVMSCLATIKWKNNQSTVTRIFQSIVENDNLDLLKLFIKPELINANALLSSGVSLLYHAAEADKLEICCILLDKGADVNWARSYLFNNNRAVTCTKPILSAAVETKNYELVKLLLDSGANPDGDFSKYPNNYKKDIPIVIAVKNNSVDIVSLLINAEANIYVREYGVLWGSDKALLEIAISNQLLDVVKLLIESAGASLNNDFHNEGVLFEKAVATKNEELVAYLVNSGVVAEKYLNETAKFFPQADEQALVMRLCKTAKVVIYDNNKQVLKQFFSYLATDKNSHFCKLPEDVRDWIIDYAVTRDKKLDPLTFENYARYHEINSTNIIDSAVLGQVTAEESCG